MTIKIFWENPYRKSIDTRIASVNGSNVTVEETIFFAFSGGQESDTGTIAGYPVIEAAKVGKEIEYTLPGDHNLKEGQSITMKIDWERRYKLMRLHFAAELILELMYKKLSGSDKIGAHIAKDKARIDFRWNESIAPLLPEITLEVESIVQKNLEINSSFSDEINEKRFWEVVGFAKVPCGGTHLKRTGEVGKLKLKRKNIGKGKERIEIYLGSESE
jgi:alanyl-tRNA synthetase